MGLLGGLLPSASIAGASAGSGRPTASANALNYSPFFRLPAAGILLDPDGFRLISEHPGASLVSAPPGVGVATKCVFIPPGVSVVDFVMEPARLGLTAGQPLFVTFALWAKQSVQISAILGGVAGPLMVATESINPTVGGSFGYGTCTMQLVPTATAVVETKLLRVRVFSSGEAGPDGCYIVGWKVQKHSAPLIDDSGPAETDYIHTVRQGQPLAGKTLIRFGDSITEFSSSRTLGRRTGMNVVNAGIGGTTMAQHINAEYDALGPVSLVNAVVSGNWSAVDAAVSRLASSGDNNAPAVARLKTIDFSASNLVTTFDYGRNDFITGTFLGAPNDTSRVTFRGSINTCISKLLGANPSIQVVLMTSHWGLHDLGGTRLDADAVPNLNGNFAIEYVDAIVEMAARNKIPCIDLWRSSGISPHTKALYLADNIHPSAAGYDLRDGKIAAALLALLSAE